MTNREVNELTAFIPEIPHPSAKNISAQKATKKTKL
jgi:hypothetical protein